MKRYFVALLMLLAALCGVSAQEKNYMDNLSDFIENTSVYEWNQEEGRSFFLPEKHLSLNGDWKFFYSATPSGIPHGFFKPEFNDKKWATIPVPSNWEMQGYGDHVFRNIPMPYKTNPPYVPKNDNPTGAYRRSFTLPASWQAHQVFLRLEKVASASFVWVNGHEAGYNEGAHEPAEYNITRYLKPGKNTIAVHVVKYSDGNYLEDQDSWRMGGIFDDVWLYATPAMRLFDWCVVTDLDDTYTDADLQVQADIKRYTDAAPAGDYTVRATLLDNDGRVVTRMESPVVKVDVEGKKTVRFSKKVKNPAKWTSDTPNLYTLNMELVAADGTVCDQTYARIGFKETEIRGETFYLNGKPLKVNAINAHMQNPSTGHVMPEDVIRNDIKTLKQFNINAVRTSHYPPTHKYLELADEYGLYIIDEVGDEAHATEWVSDDPAYTDMYRERGRQLVLRDRNHPSVLFWSAGNESGEGHNIGEVIKEGKRYDRTRYWMYGGNAYSHPAEDIIGPRYPTPAQLEMCVGLCPDSTDIRPSFMDEYECASGNGAGSFDDYWRTIYAHPRTMGGAMWDMGNVGIKEPVRQLKDGSPHNTPVHIMGNAKLVKGLTGKALDLNGHDQWVEVYRQRNVEIAGDKLTVTLDVYPRNTLSSNTSLITKGDDQFGLEQNGKGNLDFFLYTDHKKTLSVPVPDDWENHWHHIAAVYDGRKMALYIDGKLAGEQEMSGTITDFPFPINIGNNAGMYTEDAPYLLDALIDNVGVFADAFVPASPSPDKAALWLDFETETRQGYFYNRGLAAHDYGVLWPDRTPQPELWQVKKTTQPISVSWLDPATGWAEVWNRNHFLNASYYDTRWQLEADGKTIEEGRLALDVDPLTKGRVQIPFHKPELEDNVEYRITVSSRLKSDESWAEAGHEVAWDQLELPWRKTSIVPEPAMPEVTVKTTGGRYVVAGTDFRYAFDTTTGALVSMQVQGQEMLKAPLTLNVWRAPVANERDGWNAGSAMSRNNKPGYGWQIAMEYYSLGLDSLSHYPMAVDVQEVGGKAVVRVREQCLTNGSTPEKHNCLDGDYVCNGFENLYTYTVSGDGQIDIQHQVLPQGTMPLWLPRIGLTATLGGNLVNVQWYGRGPQANYPDRKTGYKIGVYSTTVDDMYEPYLIPGDYGLRTDNRWLRMTNANGSGLMFSMDQLFNFNAYTYSTDNLTKAVRAYQLQKQDGVTLNLDYATSGVGLNSLGILPGYRAMPTSYTRRVKIKPIYK